MGYVLGGIAAGVLIGYPLGGVMFEFFGESAPFVVVSFAIGVLVGNRNKLSPICKMLTIETIKLSIAGALV